MTRYWEQDICGKNILGQKSHLSYSATLEHQAFFSSLFFFSIPTTQIAE